MKRDVLHPHRLIQAELFAQALQLLVGRMIAQQQLRDVARQQVHGDEHHDADAQQHEHQLDQAGGDVRSHSHRLRCGVAARAGFLPQAHPPRAGTGPLTVVPLPRALSIRTPPPDWLATP